MSWLTGTGKTATVETQAPPSFDERRLQLLSELRPIQAEFDRECKLRNAGPSRGEPRFSPAFVQARERFCSKLAELAALQIQKEKAQRAAAGGADR